MNDPHVAGLEYKLHTDHPLVFEKDTDVDRGAYRLVRHGKRLTVEMREHFATIGGARDLVEPDVLGWSMYPALTSRSERYFWFEFEKAEVIDRSPPRQPDPTRATTLSLAGIASQSVVGACTVTVSPPSPFPDPPARFRSTLVVQTLFEWYERCRKDERLGPAAAYLALTLVKTHVRPDKAPGGIDTSNLVADTLNIEREVLNRLWHFSTEAGDVRTARKVSDKAEIRKPRPALMGVQLQWIADTIRVLALRVGEWEADPDAKLDRIATSDLWPLPAGQ
jgi:hypothetical protein